LSRGTPDDLEVLCNRIGVKTSKSQINAEIMHMRKGLEHSLRECLKKSQVTDDREKCGKRMEEGFKRDPDPVTQAYFEANFKASWDQEESEWGNKYDEEIGSKFDDEDLKVAERRR
jgi:hypothetical protein